MKLEGAKILITGGSLGIGKASAKVLVEAGAKVAITATNKEHLEQAAAEIGAFPIHADVSVEADIDKTYALMAEHFGGGLDVLINNAGIGVYEPVDELDIESFRKVFSVNVFGAAMMAKRAAIIFKNQKHGNIINIGSTAGLKGYPNATVYAASKFALRGMTECWRTELRQYNVRVMLINPSEVVTAFGTPDHTEKAEHPNKLRALEVANVIKAILELDNRGFIPELQLWATNPF